MDKFRIKEIRLSLGLTQQEYATKIPVSIRTLSKWESGITRPSKMAIIRMKQIEAEGKA